VTKLEPQRHPERVRLPPPPLEDRKMKHRKSNDNSVLWFVIVLWLSAFLLGPYLWIEFVKFCVWAGQYTWP